MSEIETHFLRGIAMFNRGEFFEAHEEMEEAMNLLEDDTSVGISIAGCCGRRWRITSSDKAKPPAPNFICAPRSNSSSRIPIVIAEFDCASFEAR